MLIPVTELAGFNALNKAYLRLSQESRDGEQRHLLRRLGRAELPRRRTPVYWLDTQEVRDFLGQFEGVVLP